MDSAGGVGHWFEARNEEDRFSAAEFQDRVSAETFGSVEAEASLSHEIAADGSQRAYLANDAEIYAASVIQEKKKKGSESLLYHGKSEQS